MAASKTQKRDVAQEVTDQIIAQLEKGVVPWHKPWAVTGGGLPRSLSTKKAYTGINTLLLGLRADERGYTNPWWGTFKQIKALGGQVQKRPDDVESGDWGTTVVFYKKIVITERQDDGTDKDKSIPLLRTFTVFNAEQTDGLPEKFYAKPEDRPEHERLEEAEAVVKGYLKDGPTLKHGGSRAYYSPSIDHIRVPELRDFDSPEAYYSVTFHEITHSTGHESRLAREGVVEHDFFGSPLYAKEELIAEIGAATLCATVGIEQETTIKNSAAYVGHWLQALKDDKKLILQAAAAANKAVQYVTGEAVAQEEKIAA